MKGLFMFQPITLRTKLFALSLILVSGCASHSTSHSMPQQKFEKLSWLTGCWVNEDGSGREVWSESFDGLLFGYSVTMKDGEVSFFEELRIEREQSKHVYIASPRATGTTEFVLTEGDLTSAIFENPAHDFPQRLHYQRNDDKLTVDVSSTDQSQGFQVNLRKCDSKSNFNKTGKTK